MERELAVYAVKISADPENATEVVTLDDGKVDKLRGVLNDMFSLSHFTKTETLERTVTDDDGNETTESVTITILVITPEHKSRRIWRLSTGSAKSKSKICASFSTRNMPVYGRNFWAVKPEEAVKSERRTVPVFQKIYSHGQ